MKRKIAILSAIFALFLIIGLWFNLMPGRYFQDRFWRFKDGAYTSWGDSVRQTGDTMELNLGDRQLTATLTDTEIGCRVDFSDGWAVEVSTLDSQIYAEIGGVIITGDTEYILTDMDAANLRFGRVVDEIHEPFYDENGNAIGESVCSVTESGESIGWHEIWYDNRPEWSTPEPETILLSEGTRLTYDDFQHNLLVNEDGEYLMNAQDVPSMQWSDTSWIGRSSVAAFLIRIATGEPTRRGHIAAIFMYVLFYLLGAANFLWPQELAFFGSRWQYRYDPELSDEGLIAMQAGGIVVMLVSIVVLFVGIG